MAGPTTHHCPKAKKGGCKKALKTTKHKWLYCPAHQAVCSHPDCKERVHLMTEPCPSCETRRVAEEKTRKEEEKKRKEKEAADKKVSMAQSEKDRNPKIKRK